MTGVAVLPLEPHRGDGRLTVLDVEAAVEGLPRGGEVAVRIDECSDFDVGAPGRLARELSGSVVKHFFGPNAWGIASHWMELYERAAAEYLAVEAGFLGRGA